MTSLYHLPLLALLFASIALPLQSQAQDDASSAPDVRIAVSESAQPLLAATARAIKDTQGLRLNVTPYRTSADDLEALASGNADIAFITKPLNGEDRSKYPDLELVATPVGMQVVAIAVSDDLWTAGVHTISQKSMLAIYQQSVTNWKELGGPDQKITLFAFAEGNGLWEIFTQWLFGDNRKATIPKVDNVANSQDARDSLEFTAGSIAPMGAALVDGTHCHALGIDLSGQIVKPTPTEVASGAYPLFRPMLAVTIGRPTIAKRAVIEFLTSDAGQKLLKSTGALGLEAVPTPPPAAPGY